MYFFILFLTFLKNRSNIAASILNAPKLLEQVYEETKNESGGSAQRELEKHLDSVSGSIERLTNQAQEFWFRFLDSESIKDVVDLGTLVLSILTEIVDHVSLLGVAGVGAFAFLKKDKSLERFCPIWL